MALADVCRSSNSVASASRSPVTARSDSSLAASASLSCDARRQPKRRGWKALCRRSRVAHRQTCFCFPPRLQVHA
eukprot:1912464-Pleurochrysis_carterae.AAC.1